MTLHPDREELMAWRDEELPAERAAEIRAHVDQCADCAREVEAFAAVSARMSQWRVDAPPTTLRAPRRSASQTGIRRTVLWAAAAVVLIGVLASARVECAAISDVAPAATTNSAFVPALLSHCNPRSLHFAWPGRATAATSPQTAPAMTPAAAFERDWLSRRRLPVPAAPGAKVTVVMYIDWQCPACRAAERAYGVVFADFEKRMPGAVTVVMKDYPLNMRCNPNVPVELHPAACEAAVAVRLAREHGTAGAMIDWLFANQETLTPDAVRKAVVTIGKATDFTARYTSVLRDVTRDIAEGHGLEVSGTPTCFINGVLARNNNGQTLFQPEEVRLAINTELKRGR